RMGYRFTINSTRNRTLPGRPDIVLPKYNSVIFVHGCFWHQHPNCIDCSNPRTRRDYWIPKLQANVRRDKINQRRLRRMGWKVLVLWDCTTVYETETVARLAKFLRDAKSRRLDGRPTRHSTRLKKS